MPDFSLIVLFKSTLALSAPLILAAMGGLASERSGIINIALEGKMLMAACVTAIAATATGNAYLGLAAGIVAATLLAMLHTVLTQAYKIDHIVSGMGINLLAVGATNFIDRKFSDLGRSAQAPTLPLYFFYVIAFAMPLLVAVYLRRTRGGLRLLAVGNSPDKSRQMGVDPIKVRYLALVATGVFCGLAGALVLSSVGRFTDNMTAGRGFIALAALILGGWRPIQALAACVAFGLLYALELQLQGSHMLGANIPSQFWNALPYLVTVIAMAGLLGRNRAPAGLGKD